MTGIYNNVVTINYTQETVGRVKLQKYQILPTGALTVKHAVKKSRRYSAPRGIKNFAIATFNANSTSPHDSIASAERNKVS